MANLRIINNLDFDACTLTSSPGCVTNAPVTNLQIGLRAKVARVTSSPWVISGVYSTPKQVSAVSIYKHNFSSIATMKVELFSDVALTSQIGPDYTATLGGIAKEWGVDFTLPAGWDVGGAVWGGSLFDAWPVSYFTLWLPSTIPAVMGFKITITDAAMISYLEAGRVYVGDYWSPVTNVAYGLSMGWKEQTKQLRTDGGSLRSEGYDPYRVFSMALDILTPAERTEVLKMFRLLGMRKDFLISVFPTEGTELEQDYTSAVKIVSMPDIVTDFFNNFKTDIQLEEV